MLELNINVCLSSSCRWFIFSETTGAYNVTTNPTGWGTPNPDLTDVTSCTLLVTDPNANETTFDLFSTTLYPNTDSSVTYNLINTDFNITGDLTDGIWTFTYTCETPEGTYTVTKKRLVACSIKCRIEALKLKIRESDCGCDEEFILKVAKLELLLDAAENAASCGYETRVTNLLDMINKLLAKKCNCGC
jgi:hypothetical protein